MPELPPDPTAPAIATHDRRLRVFVSSTLEELAAERRAVQAAITRLHLTPVMFELGARPHPPQELYRAYLAQSDVFIGVYGDRYGWVAPTADVSGLEDELQLSQDKPRLLYVRTPAPDRDPRLTALIEQVWRDGRVSTTPYSTVEELAERVADDLAVLLTERFTARAAAPGLRPSALPVPPAPLIGRQEEVASVLALLRRADVRLVTIVGPGGIGKTRLALDVAATLLPDRDGTWFVDLAPVADADLVVPTIAAAVGVHAEGHQAVLDLLLHRLSGRRVLLVLDNLEHVRGAAADLARLIAGCPGLQVLATSRSVLHLRGEHDVPLAPLPVPPSDELRAVAASPSVELLVSQARRARPDFALTPANAPAVAEIARLTEGIPLAVELVAARLRLLSPQALVARLGDWLDLRTADVDLPPRQQTLRATIDWSHDLLDEDGRALLARLSVCVGGCSLEAAEALGADLEVLSSLVGHSLVALDERGADEPRFRMLEAVRTYAAERLAERGEVTRIRERFSEHLVRWATEAGTGLQSAQNRVWRTRVDAEVDNLRAALQWALAADDAERLVRLTAPLSRYWWLRGRIAEMLPVADAAAALPSARHLPPDAAALLLWARGTMRIATGRTAEAVPLLEQLVDAARELDDDRLLGHGLTALALTRPPAEQTRAMLAEAVALFRRTDDVWSAAFALTPLGHVQLLLGDVAAAVACHQQALALAGQIDDDHLQAQAHNQLAVHSTLQGDAATAREHVQAAATLLRTSGDQEGLAYCLDALAALALLVDRPRCSARLLGAADAARQTVGVSVWPFVAPLRDQLSRAVRAALGDVGDTQEREAGATTSPLDALERGLAEVSGSGAGARSASR